MPVAVRSDDLGAFVAALRDTIAGGGSLRLLADDSACDIDGDLATAVLSFLDAAATGQAVDVTALPEEITTGQAGDLLGVSRPTVVSLIDRGELPATRIGSHRRLKTVDVLAFREQARLERSAALDELVELSDELGLYE